ncbi:MAG: ECF transporter S component [Blautia sp.]|nr:ECF transporter S component [Blautia sp.]
MKKTAESTRRLVTLALMTAIVILLANTPLGMIQLPVIKATTVHIPVILGAIILGPACGGILGAVFGICSLISNTTAPTLLSFAFSPFLAADLPGVFKAVWISVGCRIMIGVVSGWVWRLLKKAGGGSSAIWKLGLTGFIGSMTNTVFVMGSIYVLLARQYAEAREVAQEAVFGLIMGTVTAAGIPEALAAAVLVGVIGKALLSYIHRTGWFTLNER